MLHSNLSPGINAILSANEKNPGIDIKTQKKGTMFKIASGHTKYTMVVVNPEKQEVAMVTDNPEIQGTDIWYYMGAGWGGSMMKIGYIMIGAQMRMRRLSGGLIETSPVKSFFVCNEPEEAKRIMDEAGARRPQIMTEEEEQDYNRKFAELTEKFISEEFPKKNQEWIREMVGRFGNNAAKGTILGVLSQAHKHGKIKQAMAFLERDWEKDWSYQPPSVAGDPEFMPLNIHRWEALYRELNIPKPGEDGS